LKRHYRLKWVSFRSAPTLGQQQGMEVDPHLSLRARVSSWRWDFIRRCTDGNWKDNKCWNAWNDIGCESKVGVAPSCLDWLASRKELVMRQRLPRTQLWFTWQMHCANFVMTYFLNFHGCMASWLSTEKGNVERR